MFKDNVRHFGIGLRGQFLIYSSSEKAINYLPKNIQFPLYLNTPGYHVLSHKSHQTSVDIEVFAESVNSIKFTLKLSAADRKVHLELDAGVNLDISACNAFKHFYMLMDKDLRDIIDGNSKIIQG